MKEKPEKRNRPVSFGRDLALLLIILCAAGLLFALGGLFAEAGDEVVITVGSEEYGRYPLSEDLMIEIIRDGNENLVEITGGRVHMHSANCPDHLCVHQGYIDGGQFSIVCLPNRVVVEVRGHE